MKGVFFFPSHTLLLQQRILLQNLETMYFNLNVKVSK